MHRVPKIVGAIEREGNLSFAPVEGRLERESAWEAELARSEKIVLLLCCNLYRRARTSLLEYHCFFRWPDAEAKRDLLWRKFGIGLFGAKSLALHDPPVGPPMPFVSTGICRTTKTLRHPSPYVVPSESEVISIGAREIVDDIRLIVLPKLLPYLDTDKLAKLAAAGDEELDVFRHPIAAAVGLLCSKQCRLLKELCEREIAWHRTRGEIAAHLCSYYEYLLGWAKSEQS